MTRPKSADHLLYTPRRAKGKTQEDEEEEAIKMLQLHSIGAKWSEFRALVPFAVSVCLPADGDHDDDDGQ